MATVVSPFDSIYTIDQIGAPPGLPTPYGGLVFKSTDSNIILAGGMANNSGAAIYSVPVIRTGLLITGVGSATSTISAPFIDGGVAYHPSGVLFCTAYNVNQIHQFKPGSTSPDKTVDLNLLGVAVSVGSLGFIPDGYPGAGKLMVVSWPSGNCYFLNMTPDGLGTYNLSMASTGPSLPGGPEGFVYVPLGSVLFPNPSILVTEFTAGRVVAYELNVNGFPIIASSRPMVTGLFNAEGAAIDPVTGDYVFTTFGGTNSFYVLSGGFIPPPSINGGLRAGGAARITIFSGATITSAGVRVGGSADVLRDIPVVSFSAGVVGGGTAPTSMTHNVVATGGVVCDGSAKRESPVYHYPNLPDVPITPITIGGTPDIAIGYINSSSGGVTLDSDTTIKVGRRYLSDGKSADAPPDFAGVSVGYFNHLNPTTTKLVFNLDYKFSWNITSYVFREYTFLWNVGKVRQYWYRVVGRGKEGQCDPIQTNDPCCLKFIMNVQARSVADLCRKLKERKWKWPLALVERFSRPAENTAVAEDEANGINHDCNKLEPVEICKNPVCTEFCVQYDLIDRWGIGTSVQFNSFRDWTGTGSVFMGGSADASFFRNGIDFNFNTGGHIDIGGEARVLSTAYRHVAEGVLEVGGTPDIRATNWSYIGGVWPYVNAKFSGSTTDQFEDLPSDQSWFQPNRALTNDGQSASVDLSFGRKSMFLVVKGFNLGLSNNVRVLGFKAEVNRYANSMVRDAEVYLVLGDEIISDNMADTSTTWPLGVPSVKTYGGTFNQWRDPNDPDYLGEWDINDVASPEFGLAIRVSPDLIGLGITAFIENINLYVYTEQVTDSQSLRTAGSALVKSSNYKYTGSGSVTVSQGGARIRVHRRVFNTGRGSLGPDFIAIRMGGQYGLNMHYAPAGNEVSVGGVAGVKSSRWRTIAEGEVEIGGEARVRSSNYSWTMNGGLTFGGAAVLRNKYKYRLTGGVVLDGTVNLRLSFSYVATGGLTFEGNPNIRSSAFKWVSDGNAIFIGGGVDVNYSDYGTLIVGIGVTTFVEDVLLTFPVYDSVNTLKALTNTVTRCKCNGMPFLVPFTHNMFTNNKFTQFLNRNGLKISRVLNLSYNEPNDSWQANLHFKGRSAQNNAMESWEIVFDLRCTSNVDGDEIGQSVWRFGAHYWQKNLSTLEDYDTRILVAFIPDRICLNENFNAAITIDTVQNLVSVTPTSTVYQQLLYDNIGLFKNDYWTLNPDIVIQISQTGVPAPIPRYVVNIGV